MIILVMLVAPQRLRGLSIGEARKKCNGDDRRQRRIQGGAVGAAACRMRVPPKARSRRRVPQPVGSSASKSLRPCRAEHAAFASQTGLRLKSPTGAFMPSGHRRPFWFSFVRQKRTPSAEILPIKAIESFLLVHTLARSANHSRLICSPESSARISAPVAGRLRTR